MIETQTFIVNRDGHPDREWLYEQRMAALQRLGESTLHIALQTPIIVGKGVVWLFTHETPRPVNDV